MTQTRLQPYSFPCNPIPAPAPAPPSASLHRSPVSTTMPSSDDPLLDRLPDAFLSSKISPAHLLSCLEPLPLNSGSAAFEDFGGIVLGGDGRYASGNISDLSIANSEKVGTSSAEMRSSPQGPSLAHPRGQRVKFMCSYAGKILPRPSDAKLRYVGGETRIVSVDRHIHYADLMQKMADIYGQDLALKYQLPDEDLDALVSVSSDEDVENMMDECDRLDSCEGSSRLRVFLFSAAEYDVTHLSTEMGDPKITEQRYVDAVNAAPEASLSRRNDLVTAASLQNSTGLDSWNATERVEKVSLSSRIPHAEVVSSGKSAPTGIPLSLKTVVSTNPPAPISPPHTPSQSFFMRPSAVFEAPPQFSLDSLAKVSGPQCAVLRSDGNSHDVVEYGGSASSSASSQHELHHRFCESRRSPNSPTQTQLELASSGNYQDQEYTAEQRRIVAEITVQRVDSNGRMHRIDSDSRLPRVESHGKLHLQEQLVELASQSAGGDNRLDNQLPDISSLHADLHWPGARQLQLPQAGGQQQQQAEVHPDKFTRMDIAQQPASNGGHMQQQALQQQQQVPLFDLPSAASGHETTARCHMEHLQNKEGTSKSKSSPPSTSGAQSVTGLTSAPIFQIGSAPSSPRTGLRDSAGKQSGAQQHLQIHQVSNEDFSDQDYPKKLHNHNGQTSRAFYPSPQQEPLPFFSSENIPQEQVVNPVKIQYELPQAQDHYFDGRPIVASHGAVDTPHTTGLATSRDRQEFKDGSSLLKEQQKIGTPHRSPQLEFQEHLLHFGELSSAHPQNRQDNLDWVLHQRDNGHDELRVQATAWVQTGQKESKVEGSNAGQVACSRIETGTVNSPSVGLLEESIPSRHLVASSTYAAAQHRNRQFDPIESIPSHPRAALPTSVMGGDLTTLDRVTFSDTLHADQWVDCLPVETSAGISASGSVDFPVERHQRRGELAATGRSELMMGGASGVLLPSMCVPRKSEDESLFSVFDPISTQNQYAQKRIPENVVTYVGNHNLKDEEGKGSLENVTENVAAAVFHPSLFSSPNLVMQDWETSLLDAELEEQDVEQSLSEEQSPEEIILDIVTEKGVTFEEVKMEIEEVGRVESVVNETSNAAAVAEAEAIARGLQTIRNFDLEELRELGSGTFGTVYHGKWRGTDVAIKRIKSSCFTGRPSERERLMADFWREAYILGQLHHPNVVAFYGVVPDSPGGTLATVTEYMINGSLKQVLQKKDRTLDRRKRLLIAMDTAFGMEYLHGKNVVHFDLKCENLLVNLRDTQRPICKVGDLGLSKVKQQTMVSGGVRGTLPWMAPELLNGSSSLVCEKVDVFSFGIVLWELLTGEEPYANMHYGAIIGGIVNNTLRPPIPNWCDPAWRSLMEQCWSADPAERPTFSKIAGSLRAMAAMLNTRVQGQAHTP